MQSLPENIFLLSIDDHGEIVAFSSKAPRYGLACGLLAELALQGKIVLRTRKLVVVDSTSLGDELLDGILGVLRETIELHKTTYWIIQLASRTISKKGAAMLVEKQVLAVDEKRYRWVIPYQPYPTRASTEKSPICNQTSATFASAKFFLKQHLRSVVLANSQPEPHDIALLSRLKACRLLNLVFTDDERKMALRRVTELAKSEPFGEAVTRTRNEIESAA